MAYCSNCGNNINEGALFCGACGQKIIQQTKVIKVNVNTCPKCNTPFEEDEKFCAECGTAVNERVTKDKEISPKKIIRKTKPKVITTIKSNPPRKKKKGGILRTIGKIVVGFIAFVVVGSIILYNLDDDWEEATISQEEIVDYSNDTYKNSTEREKILNPNKNDTERKQILDSNDKNLADKYRNGIGVEPDQYKAFELYKKLASKGDLHAMVELADYYEQGIWVKKDLDKAKSLLRKAAEAGSIGAKWQLEFLESDK